MVDFPQAGITRGDIDWILLNMPELKNVKFMMNGPICMSVSFATAAEAVAAGLTKTCLVVRGWHNLAGRYYVGRARPRWTPLAGPGSTAASGACRLARPPPWSSRSTATSTARTTT